MSKYWLVVSLRPCLKYWVYGENSTKHGWLFATQCITISRCRPTIRGSTWFFHISTNHKTVLKKTKSGCPVIGWKMTKSWGPLNRWKPPDDIDRLPLLVVKLKSPVLTQVILLFVTIRPRTRTISFEYLLIFLQRFTVTVHFFSFCWLLAFWFTILPFTMRCPIIVEKQLNSKTSLKLYLNPWV